MTNQEVFRLGEVHTQYAVDIDPATGDTVSNGGYGSLVTYDEWVYEIIHDYDEEVILDADEEAVPIEWAGVDATR